MTDIKQLQDWLDKIEAGEHTDGTIAFGDDAWQAIEYCKELAGMVDTGMKAYADLLLNSAREIGELESKLTAIEKAITDLPVTSVIPVVRRIIKGE